MRPCRVSKPTRTLKSGRRADALGRGGAAPCRHFDQGVGPALARGPGQLVDAPGAAQALFGLGTVGLEEVVFDPVELIGDNGAVDRVERASGPATCR